MDCNKEEAFRARDMAERKMQSKDFSSARKIALKAQQLYSDLDNISQILMVCDVHCSADKKLPLGNEMDWYGILQIEQTADEAMIKKQYRKFALLLHPDKNNFPGAESAFKLIGEAQRVLLDKGKRQLHDMKRGYKSKPAPAYRAQQRTAYSQNIGVQTNYRNNVTGINSQPPQQAAQQRASNGRKTFWTACPFCHVKYEYYVEVMNKSLICQTCTKPFIAYERTTLGAATGTNLNPSTIPPRRDVPGQGFSKVELTSQGNSTARHSKPEVFQRKAGNTELGSQKVNDKRQRRRKRDSESSESFESDSSSEDDDFTAGVNLGSNGERPRRSVRQRQNVSYKENGSDDEDFPGHPKKAKGSPSSPATEKEEDINDLKGDPFKTNKQFGVASGVKDQNRGQEKEGPKSLHNERNDPKDVKGKEREEDGRKENSEADVDSASNLSSKSSDRDLFEYAEPDFNDFEEGKSKESFSTGQVWALYDNQGAMPRFYARIRKVISFTEFKVRITWLEPTPDIEDEIEWASNGLPVSCGKFKEGISETTEERLMFSHTVSWERGTEKDIYMIFPRKGETWAIIKNWSLEWKSQNVPSEKFEYEFVEILSDYTEGVGVTVGYLGKLKGFVCVFCRISKEGNATFQIPQGEVFRFSHMIPSYKLTDKEKLGVPKGSFELDPASLPTNIEEFAVPEDIVVEVGNNHLNGSCSRSDSDKMKAETESHVNTSRDHTDVETKVEIVSDDDFAPASDPETIEIPEAEFFDFDAVKTKFEVGQIWSLYSDEDGLPKYYAQITKMASPRDGFKVRLRWLASSGLPNGAIQWNDKHMLISCGSFEPRKGGGQTYTTEASFSHPLSAVSTGKKYAIMPKKGQVWALYRNWTAKMSLSDLENCEYDIVEVLEENDFRIKVSSLEKVDGFKSVFKAQRKEGSTVIREILIAELLRFSHQIPAFKLTNEKNGSLRGFWELDPAALPVHFFAQ